MQSAATLKAEADAMAILFPGPRSKNSAGPAMPNAPSLEDLLDPTAAQAAHSGQLLVEVPKSTGRLLEERRIKVQRQIPAARQDQANSAPDFRGCELLAIPHRMCCYFLRHNHFRKWKMAAHHPSSFL